MSSGIHPGKIAMKRVRIFSGVVSLMLLTFAVMSVANSHARAAQAGGGWSAMDYPPAPADNPLKGFMPFYDAYGSANAPIANDFPHSMEYFYVPLRDLMNGPNSFTFNSGMEPQLIS